VYEWICVVRGCAVLLAAFQRPSNQQRHTVFDVFRVMICGRVAGNAGLFQSPDPFSSFSYPDNPGENNCG